MKRLLCIISCMNTGGAETFLMKIYRKLDKTKYQMDFCVNTDENFYADEIEALGGKIYKIPTKSQSVKAFTEALTDVIKTNGYDHVLRITSNAMGFMDLKVAKKAGAKRTIARSSNSGDSNGIKSLLAHKAGGLMYTKYVDVKIAPSDLAAIYTFGKRAYESGNVQLLHNAIDLDVFKYSTEARRKIRGEFGISDDTLLVGHVGRFDAQKNHKFLIDIFEKMVNDTPDCRLMLVGKGGLEDEIKAKLAEKGLTQRVIFTGVRKDVPDILSAFDVFVFPSFYEGMPNTVIEAQAAGLPCIISDTITKGADITGLVEYLSLDTEASAWAKKAIDASRMPRRDTKEDLLKNRYDIQSIVEDFVKIVFDD